MLIYLFGIWCTLLFGLVGYILFKIVFELETVSSNNNKYYDSRNHSFKTPEFITQWKDVINCDIKYSLLVVSSVIKC